MTSSYKQTSLRRHIVIVMQWGISIKNLARELKSAIFLLFFFLAGFIKKINDFFLIRRHTIEEVDLAFSRSCLTETAVEGHVKRVGMCRQRGQRRSEQDREKEQPKAWEMRRNSTEQCRKL